MPIYSFLGYDFYMKIFSQRIKELRIYRNISQQELATILGVNQRTISNWEVREIEPDYDILVLIANYFDVTTDYILGVSSCDLSPSVLREPYTSEFLMQDVILMLKKLPPELRQAQILLLEEINFGVNMRMQAKQKGR